MVNRHMTFETALTLLRAGRRLSREGWNGKDMFVFLVPGSRFEVNRHPLLGMFPEGTQIEYRPHLDLRATDGTIGVWTPSHTDILAEDWYEV